MDESPTEHFEQAEHAEHVAHLGDRRLTLVSIIIAALAVLAAAVGSLETIETAASLGAKNEAVLMQARASDAWGFYQAKSMKKNLYAAFSEAAIAKAPDFAARSGRYAKEQDEIRARARNYEAEVGAALNQSEGHERAPPHPHLRRDLAPYRHRGRDDRHHPAGNFVAMAHGDRPRRGGNFRRGAGLSALISRSAKKPRRGGRGFVRALIT